MGIKVSDFIDGLTYKTEARNFGNIELTYPSPTENGFLKRLLSRSSDEREFVARVLYHQLESPQASFDEFNKIPDYELVRIVREYAKKEPMINGEKQVFASFDETANNEILFTNFKSAIKSYVKESDRLHRKIMGGLDYDWMSTRRLAMTLPDYISGMNKAFYSSAAEAAMRTTPGILQDTLHYARTAAGSDILSSERKHLFNHIYRPLAAQYDVASSFLASGLSPQVTFWQSWVHSHRDIFYSHSRFWDQLFSDYDIAEEEAVKILMKYKWFVSPSLPASFVYKAVSIGKKRGNQRKVINALFIEYFSSGSYRNLASMVAGWKDNDLFKRRMKILRGCVSTLRNSKPRMNPSNIVLPALIGQIEGISSAYMKKMGLTQTRRGYVDSTGSQVNWKKWFKDNISDNNDDMETLASNIFLDILFQESTPGMPLNNPFTLNRHKIMHGESIRYGRFDNTIRAFLILDFLASLN